MKEKVFVLLEGETNAVFVAPFSAVEKAQDGADLWNKQYSGAKIKWEQETPDRWLGKCKYKSKQGSFRISYQIIQSEIDPDDCRSGFEFINTGGPDAQIQLQAGEDNPPE